ncbi:macrolide transport system ATP-binding/permease protein [Halobacillus karajensis]|uniref:hypothetical protein n=1 Tax=Halobacillus karajensis TaxID=195088 RepID=UPI0008A79CF2|nr:macrolide transport system ATP-binding/permease protein [Halobacillus karajensis]
MLKLLAGSCSLRMEGAIDRHADFGYFEQVEGPSVNEADPKLLGKWHVPKHSEAVSGGEETRMKLAQLFTHYYECLLIDDPTTHLD